VSAPAPLRKARSESNVLPFEALAGPAADHFAAELWIVSLIPDISAMSGVDIMIENVILDGQAGAVTCWIEYAKEIKVSLWARALLVTVLRAWSP
jgi:hypothetical protein